MTEYQRKRRFLIDAETKKEFAKKFNCDVRTVEKAMYFTNKSPLAKLMQIEARKRDLIVWVDAPECETIHTWDKPASNPTIIAAQSSTLNIRRQLTTSPSNSTATTQIAYTL